MKITPKEYAGLLNNTIIVDPTDSILLIDHLRGFDINLKNKLLDLFLKNNYKNQIHTQYQIDFSKLSHYDSLNINHDTCLQNEISLKHFHNYTQHPALNYKNFICSFNGSAHVGRKLLVSILKKFKYFNPEYCSKNFCFTEDMLSGHIDDFTDNDIFYKKFFISDKSDTFFQSINSFGLVQCAHDKNIYNLQSKLTESFLHIVSETLATSYYPYVTEKFLYSIVTRGLFLAHAQPGWHAHVEKYYGFRRYTKLFNYRFDELQNPVERLIELMCMISKFNNLTTDEWRDLYLLELDTIEYNYDHYFSGRYLDYQTQNQNDK